MVSDIAGTTRDALSAQVILPHGSVRFIDCAGLDEQEPAAEIDAQMRRHALQTIEAADFVILVKDCTDLRPDLWLPRTVDLKLFAKVDLLAPSAGPSPGCAGEKELSVSAHTECGIVQFRRCLDELAFGNIGGQSRRQGNQPRCRIVRGMTKAVTKGVTKPMTKPAAPVEHLACARLRLIIAR